MADCGKAAAGSHKSLNARPTAGLGEQPIQVVAAEGGAQVRAVGAKGAAQPCPVPGAQRDCTSWAGRHNQRQGSELLDAGRQRAPAHTPQPRLPQAGQVIKAATKHRVTGPALLILQIQPGQRRQATWHLSDTAD